MVQDGVIDACTPGLQSAIRTAATVLEKVLLPALMVTPANPAMSFEVWEVLKLLPYEVRHWGQSPLTGFVYDFGRSARDAGVRCSGELIRASGRTQLFTLHTESSCVVTAQV